LEGSSERELLGCNIFKTSFGAISQQLILPQTSVKFSRLKFKFLDLSKPVKIWEDQPGSSLENFEGEIEARLD